MDAIPLLTPDQLADRYTPCDDVAPDAVVEVAEEVTDGDLLPIVFASPLLYALWSGGQQEAALEFAFERYVG